MKKNRRGRMFAVALTLLMVMGTAAQGAAVFAGETDSAPAQENRTATQIAAEQMQAVSQAASEQAQETGGDNAAAEKARTAEAGQTGDNSQKSAGAEQDDAAGTAGFWDEFTTEDGVVLRMSSESYAAVYGYTGSSGDMIIPGEFVNPADGKKYPVTKIFNNTNDYANVVNLVIPDSVTWIRDQAFAGEAGAKLKSVKIGNGLSDLDHTFKNCASLETVTLGDSVENIDGAFDNCSSLKELTLPASLKGITSLKGTAIQKIDLPAGVQTVKKVDLPEVALPDSVSTIDFSYCTKLEKIHLGSGITELPDNAFSGCENLTAVTGGANVTKIGDSCFSLYKNKKWASDSKLTSLGDIDFSKVTSIGDYAFTGLSSLACKDVDLSSATDIGRWAFYNTPLITYKDGTLNLNSISQLGTGAFSKTAGIKKLVIGDGLTEIPASAFEKCADLEAVSIPDSVTSIGNSAFHWSDPAKVDIGTAKKSSLRKVGEKAFYDGDLEGAKGSNITIHTSDAQVMRQDNSFDSEDVLNNETNGAKSNPETAANGSAVVDNVTYTAKSEKETAIYLDGIKGSDSSDGTSREKAVRTFEKAKELARAAGADSSAKAGTDKGQTVIYVTGTVDVTGDISLEGTNAIVKRDREYKGSMLKIPSGKSAAFSDITIDGNRDYVDAKYGGSLVEVESNATLDIKDGTVLQNNQITTGQITTGGAIDMDSNAVVNMTGGTIQNNEAVWGGGVYADSGSRFNMSGGIIKNNHAGGTNAAGGGICIYANSDAQAAGVSISDGAVIQDNASDEVGGGISVGNGNVSNGAEILNMTGGRIDGNTAGSDGGGIFVQAGKILANGTANISGGSITNNRMDGKGQGNKAFGGGGIYVNGVSPSDNTLTNGVLNLTTAVITDNSAGLQGGGYAACPVSESHIYVKNGVAIYGNEAKSAQDIYVLASNYYGPHSGSPYYTVANAMLGGIPYHWKDDSGNEVPLNELDGQLMAQAGEELSLHTDEKASEHTKELARVTISGNSSVTRGGGIGSNGTVNMGSSNETKVRVQKVWKTVNDDQLSKIPASIEIDLYRAAAGSSEKPVLVGFDTMKPDKDGNWAPLIFKNLPKEDQDGNEYIYTVKEKNVKGWTATVKGTQDYGYVITNEAVEKISVPVTKVWQGSETDSVKVHLMNGDKEVASGTLTKQDGWKYTFENLDKYDSNGKEIVYTLREDAVNGYASNITGNMKTGFTVTNTEKTSVSVTKQWDGKALDQVRANLYADGKKVDSHVLNKANGWHYSFTDLDKTTKDGELIKYTVDEDPVSGYTKKITGNAASGFVITNTEQTTPEPEKTSVSVTKQWDGKALDQVRANLYADGKKVDSHILNKANGWHYSFTDLDKTTKDGELIKYTVDEDPISGYTKEITGNMDNGFVITNTEDSHTPPHTGGTSVTVAKHWNGTPQDQVNVRLYADGVEVASHVLNADNGWKYTFTGLDETRDGKKIEYTVDEDGISGYTKKIEGNADDGFVITNTEDSYTPPHTDTPDQPGTPANTPGKPGNHTTVTTHNNLTTVNNQQTPSEGVSLIPKTGDVSELGLWAGIGIAAAVAVIAILLIELRIKKRRRERSDKN